MVAYSPFTWVDDDGTLTTGTLYSAARMNAIEAGVYNAAVPIEHDAISTSGSFTTTKSWTHTPVVRQPRGILVLIDADTASTDEVTSVEYGGVVMEEIAGSPFSHTEGAEDSVIHAFFLGAGIPPGANSVTVTVTGTKAKLAACISIAADKNLRVEGNNMTTKTVAATTKVDFEKTGGTGSVYLMYAVLHSGNDAVGTVTATGSGTMLAQFDYGAATVHLAGLLTPRAGEGVITFAQGSDEAGGVALQIARVRDFGLVTALPSVAGKGDTCDYVADSEAGVVWHLVYDGQGSYPWKKIGGSRLFNEQSAEQNTASTTFANLGTVGPAITVPLAGDYDITVGMNSYFSPASANSAGMSYAVGAAAASDQNAAEAHHTSANISGESSERTTRALGLAAGVALTAKYKVTGGTGAFRWRRMWLDPVRVG